MNTVEESNLRPLSDAQPGIWVAQMLDPVEGEYAQYQPHASSCRMLNTSCGVCGKNTFSERPAQSFSVAQKLPGENL
jgi:hypothetical protein